MIILNKPRMIPDEKTQMRELISWAYETIDQLQVALQELEDRVHELEEVNK